jgi:general secretion pathway protein H
VSSETTRATGFTLIEMLVVLVILGLALAIVAGFLPRGYATVDLATGSDGLANTLRLARERAVTHQQPVTFTATVDGRFYVLDGQIRPLPPALSLGKASTPVIRFSPDGSSTGGTIWLTVGGRSRLVRVDQLTGRVTVGNAP